MRKWAKELGVKSEVHRLAVGYVRVSTDKQEHSPEAQTMALREWAQYNHIKLVGPYEDIGYSGATPWVERPGLREAVAEIKKQKASHLVVWRSDRLTRDMLQSEMLLRTIAPAEIVTVQDDPDQDQMTPERQLMRQVLMAAAQYERGVISLRTRLVIDKKRKNGDPIGCIPMEATPEEFPTAKLIWQLHCQGMSVREVTRELQKREIKTRRGRRSWAFSTVAQVIARMRKLDDKTLEIFAQGEP